MREKALNNSGRKAWVLLLVLLAGVLIGGVAWLMLLKILPPDMGKFFRTGDRLDGGALAAQPVSRGVCFRRQAPHQPPAALQASSLPLCSTLEEMSLPDIVLASASPRRSQLLRQMGLSFRVKPVDADETLPAGAASAEAASELARRKAIVAMETEPDALVIAADTLVTVGGRILGKPRTAGSCGDAADAPRVHP